MELIVGRAALLVIDMQHDFCDSDVGTYAPGALEIIQPISSLIQRARESDTPVIFTQEIHRPDHLDAGRERDPGAGLPYPGASADDPLPAHCVAGTTGVEIVEELAPQPHDVRILKRRYSCFLGTDLQLVLNGLQVSTLLVTGVCSNICVLWTAGDAYQRDYHVRVIEDCVAGTSPEEHAAALTIMRPLTFPERPVLSGEVLDVLAVADVVAGVV
ncbi:MAG: cysteine hydrolase family protein [Solirubrobacteraceae bacterium]